MLLELFAQIFQLLFDLVPRPVLVPYSNRAVCILLGKWCRVLNPGLYVVIPILEEFEEYTVTDEVSETAILAVSDSDGRSWQVRLAIGWRTGDPMLAHTRQVDPAIMLEQRAGAGLVRVMSQMTSASIVLRGPDQICKKVRDRLADRMIDRGLVVESVSAVMFDRCRSFFFPMLNVFQTHLEGVSMLVLSQPIKRHGGKGAHAGKLAKWILSKMPEHTHFVEPYFGGGAVLLRKDPQNVSEVVNDLDGDLSNFWSVLADREAFLTSFALFRQRRSVKTSSTLRGAK